MENKTEKTDAERMVKVISALGTTANGLAVKLGYKSHASVYHVINGVNNMSEGMMERIVKTFPQVSYNYLKKGEHPIILDEENKISQANLFNIAIQENSEVYLFKKFLKLPDQLARIEEKLDRLLGEN